MPFERLKEAREKAGFSGPTEAAVHFGWPKSTYISNENGTREFSKKGAQKYARGFRVSAGWLLYGEGQGPKDRSGAPEKEDGMPDQEVLEIAIRQALRYTAGSNPADIAHATTVLYRLLAEKKAEGVLINDDVAAQAMLEKLRQGSP